MFGMASAGQTQSRTPNPAYRADRLQQRCSSRCVVRPQLDAKTMFRVRGTMTFTPTVMRKDP